MRRLDIEYQASALVSERRHYKIFYSHIHAFPLLVLGQNPGGAENGENLAASESYFK